MFLPIIQKKQWLQNSFQALWEITRQLKHDPPWKVLVESFENGVKMTKNADKLCISETGST